MPLVGIPHSLYFSVFYSLQPAYTRYAVPRLRQKCVEKQIIPYIVFRIKSMEWAAFDYNFSLEQGVLSSDINMDSIRIDGS
jgi:hypothetical protein